MELSNVLDKLKKKTETQLKGVGALIKEKKIYLYYLTPNSKDHPFRVATSSDGFHFHANPSLPEIYDLNNAPVSVETIKILSLFSFKNTYYMYYRTLTIPRETFYATTTDLLHWKTEGKINALLEKSVLIPQYTSHSNHVILYGEKIIRQAFSKDFVKWEYQEKTILEPHKESFDAFPLQIELTYATDKGIIVIYHSREETKGIPYFRTGTALLDPDEPDKIIWRSPKPLWQQPKDWNGKPIYHVATVLLGEKIIGYWGWEGEGIFAVVYSLLEGRTAIDTKAKPLRLSKAKQNPILTPRKEYKWESAAAFNPAALYENDRIHLLYRAIGEEGYLSVLGYASSSDGFDFDHRPHLPAYTPREGFEFGGNQPYSTLLYSSGGGFGGCEDPRLTRIGGRIYMTYVAYDGMNPPRVALTSISADDFLNQRWLWEKPVLISPPGVVDKNAVLFPEKINGKYVVMHRIFPNILIDYVDDLQFDGNRWLKGQYKIAPRKGMWDSRKIGAGAPPMRTQYGWLLIYHTVGDHDPGKYKIGAMLLDINDPTKVLHRSNNPILEPTEAYENEGFKAGVSYPCGAVLFKDQIFVYYGGADTVVCVATAPLQRFLDELRYTENAHLEPVTIQRVM